MIESSPKARTVSINTETVDRLRRTGYTMSKAIWIASFIVDDDVAFGKAQKAWQVSAGLRKEEVLERKVGVAEQRAMSAAADEAQQMAEGVARWDAHMKAELATGKWDDFKDAESPTGWLESLFNAPEGAGFVYLTNGAGAPYWMIPDPYQLPALQGILAQQRAMRAKQPVYDHGSRHSSRSDVQPAEQPSGTEQSELLRSLADVAADWAD